MTWTWCSVFLAVLVWSGHEPNDRFTWWLEVLPALAAFGLLFVTRRIFPLTPLVYRLLLIECIILMIGGHYTYARVPWFDWIGGLFGWTRNNFDKLAHFSQGFVPAIVMREILIRFEVVNGRSWLFCLVASLCLAVSAFYELIEWWVALVSGSAAEAFLGTQGYEWDTQSDMALALLGALSALLLLGRSHDRQLSVPSRTGRG